MGINRRDFLKLSALGIAVAVGARVVNKELAIESNSREIYMPPTPENATFLCFDIEKQITPDIISTLISGFTSLSSAAIEQSKLNLEEDNNILGKFDNNTYLKNSVQLINSIANLQSIYVHFRDEETPTEENTLAINEIKKRFYKLALPLSLFYREFKDSSQTSNNKFSKLYNQYLPLTSEVPSDPLIGDEIYDQIGDESWFYDFDMAVDSESKRYIGTYPVTRKFFYQSGYWMNRLANESGASFNNIYQSARPDKGNINKINYPLEDNLKQVEIPVEKEVIDDILNELEKIGLDRSFSNIIFRNADGDEFYGGAVYISHDSLSRNGDINIFRNSDMFTQEFYQRNKIGVIFSVVHEIFHVLSGKIDLLNPIDHFKALSMLKKLNFNLNPIFKKNELCGESNSYKFADNIFQDNVHRIQNFSETKRTIYLFQHLMRDMDDTLWPELSRIGIYDKYFDQDLKNFVSVRIPIEFDLSKRFAAAKYSESYFILKVKQYYSQNKSAMDSLDKFVYEELIDRGNKNGLYSEPIIWYENSDTETYYSSTIPLLLIYTSMARGDGAFMGAIKKDLDDAVKSGRITDLEGKFQFRRMLLLSKQIAEKNQYSETSIAMAEEGMADQFSFAMIGNLSPDLNNYFSGIKAEQRIRENRDGFIELIQFYKHRNLAELITKSRKQV